MSTERGTTGGRTLAWGLALALCACSEAETQPGMLDAATPPVVAAPWQGQLPVQAVMAGAGCPLAGTVRDCGCGPGTAGKQTCLPEGWGACACAPAPAGASGAGGAASEAPAAFEPTAEQEPPTDVVFDWPETDPSHAVACEPGHYVGMFSCGPRIVTADGEPAFELSGTVDMHLEQTADGEILRIADGTFASARAVAIPAWADVVGELDCSTGRFAGRLENGQFSVALGLPIPFTQGTFMGDLSADYDPALQALDDGDWNMVGQLDGFPGSCMDGTWNAVRVGP